MKRLIIWPIKIYQLISKNILRYNLVPIIFYSSCRFYPTCSEYAVESINRDGIRAGLHKAMKRIFRCHPWASPGVDMP